VKPLVKKKLIQRKSGTAQCVLGAIKSIKLESCPTPGFPSGIASQFPETDQVYTTPDLLPSPQKQLAGYVELSMIREGVRTNHAVGFADDRYLCLVARNRPPAIVVVSMARDKLENTCVRRAEGVPRARSLCLLDMETTMMRCVLCFGCCSHTNNG
jgi:hypothetical protein